jgi:hypothetical protein
MAATYDFLGETVADGNSGTLSIASIPQTHNDLVLFFEGWGVSGAAPAVTDGYLRFNNNAVNNTYSSNLKALGFNGHAKINNWYFNNNYCWLPFVPLNSSANYYDRYYFQMDINNYRKLLFSTTEKYINMLGKFSAARGDYDNGAMGTASYGFHNNDPITSVSVTLSNAAYLGNGSKLQIYGIANS